jgi:integrase
MGRRRIGSKPYSVTSNRGTATLRATIAGYRVKISLGVPWAADRRSASKIEAIAAAKYAELVAGRVTAHDPRLRTSHTLEELIAMWLTDIEPHRQPSYRMFETHARTFVRFGPVADFCADTGPRSFATSRLGEVTRSTVRKELSSMFQFFDWAIHHGHINSAPPRPTLQRGVAGKRSGPQRPKAVDVTREEALAIIKLLPEWCETNRAEPFRVRDAIAFAYETGLRPSTIARLEVPTHWVHGRKMLTITADIDKARYSRECPLSATAITILERCAGTSGPIFGRHDYRIQLKRAAAAVLDSARAKSFAAYDFRHARTTHLLAESNDLLGTAYLVGHRQITTTNRYAHAALGHATRAIASVDKLGPLSAPDQKRPINKERPDQ